jgi:hypothetical protein
MRRSVLLIAALLLSSIAYSQVRISLNLNLDRQPIWGPTGYDHVEYYYFPDIDTYYNVSQERFYSFERRRWTGTRGLPARHRGFDLYGAYKVVVNDPTPYRRGDYYRKTYSSFKGRRGQESIRDSRDERYFPNVHHPSHDTWVRGHPEAAPQRNDTRGRGEGDRNRKH